MTHHAAQALATIWGALGGSLELLPSVRFTAEGELGSAFAVTDLAAASIAAACLATAELTEVDVPKPAIVVDRRLASFWFRQSIAPIGWATPPLWDPVAGDYETADGWLRLHTNAPHHRRAALSVLGTEPTREAIARGVRSWRGEDLETAIVARGGCAAVMRSLAAWTAHPQGQAVASARLVDVEDVASGPLARTAASAARPLAGVRVLDMTRVLAGPVATRFLAGFGAEVLRIDPPDWDEPGIIPEVALGKRCARLDLREASDRAVWEALLGEADVWCTATDPARSRGSASTRTDVRSCAPASSMSRSMPTGGRAHGRAGEVSTALSR